MDVHLELSDDPAAADLALIGDGLAAFNAADVGPSGRQSLTVLIRNGEGVTADAGTQGGLYGYTAWGWLYIQWLFVPEQMRGNGLAGGLLAMAEDEARGRGCHAAWIDTFNSQALRTYQRHGYRVFGELADFPQGRTRSFLQKNL